MDNLVELVRHNAVVKSDKIMMYKEDGGTFFYKDVHDRALRFAGGLRQLGIEKGMRIGVLMLNSYRWQEIFYGNSALGGIVVPLNLRLAGPEMIYQINDSGCKVLIFDPLFAKIIQSIKDSLETVEHFIYTQGDAPLEGAIAYESLLDAEPYREEVTKDDLFAIYYTGGTTGLAKGVMLSHRNIIANAYNTALTENLTPDDIFLHSVPMFHMGDASVNFALTLVGASHAFVPMFEPVAVLKAIEKYRITIAGAVPTMINMLINHPDAEKYDLSSLRLMVYGASPIAPDILQKAMDLFKCGFIQQLGTTEASPNVTILLPEDHIVDPEDPKSLRRLLSCGREPIGAHVRVVDRNGKDVKPGEIGEIIIKGDNVMVGYWGKPLETEQVLRDGWYWTRDLAQIDEENYIYIVDRAKDMIISGAENIYTIEVENAIYKHPAILEAAVIGVLDEKWGEIVKACVVLKTGTELNEEELIDFCRRHIASYKCPKSVDFLDALPKSGAGKILKRELRELYWKGHERKVG